MDDLKSNRACTALKVVRRSPFWGLAESARAACHSFDSRMRSRTRRASPSTAL